MINNDPAIAYLLNSNRIVDQKLVMAHVYGHVDFFKNNVWFSKTNRKMVDQMANHRTRVRRYMDQFGIEPVENWIDVCLSLENLIDPYLPFEPKKREKTEEEAAEEFQVQKIPVERSYMDKYINPSEYLEGQKEKLDSQKEKESGFPEHPQRDVLKFLIEYAGIEEWKLDVLGIIREEAYYFAPQGMTKIMNEGWASYWHSKIMTQKAMNDSEVVDYADACASVFSTAPGQFNPYKLGIELFRDIEERWDKGMFGPEWEDCHDVVQRREWDKGVGKGREKMFEVRKLYNDVTFVDEFFTEDFCARNNYYKYIFNPQTQRNEISTRDFLEVKEQLLFALTNMGRPVIQVIDGNYQNRGELLLEHRHQGVDLDLRYAEETLRNLMCAWGRPVSIKTEVDKKVRILSFDEKGFKVNSEGS